MQNFSVYYKKNGQSQDLTYWNTLNGLSRMILITSVWNHLFPFLKSISPCGHHPFCQQISNPPFGQGLK